MLTNHLHAMGMFVKLTIKINMTKDEIKAKFDDSDEGIRNREKYLLTCSVNPDTIAQGQLVILSDYELHGNEVIHQDGNVPSTYKTLHYNCDYLKPDGTFGTIRWIPPEYLTAGFSLDEMKLSDEDLKKFLNRSLETTNMEKLDWMEYIANVR